MFILRDILTPLQQDFSDTAQGKKRSIWFAYTLLAVVVPFTSSMTSNLLRSLEVLFGIKIPFQRRESPVIHGPSAFLLWGY